MGALALALGVVLAGPSGAVEIRVSGFDFSAISSAVAQARPGDTVLLPEGTYTIHAALALRSGISLTGVGQEKTIIRFAGDKPSVLVAFEGCEDVTLSDLTLDAAESPLVKQGISGYNSRRLKILRVSVRNLVKSDTWGPHGILFSGDNPTHEHGVTDSVIADCDISNIAPDAPWGAGIRMAWGSSRNQVIGCRIDNTGRGGIFGGDQSNDLVIRDNVVTRSHGEMLGIEVWGGCDRCVIEDNVIDHWLSIGGCDWCAVRRNTISAGDGSFGFIGIEAIGSFLVFTDNVVDDGQIIGLSMSNVNVKQYHYYGNNTFRRCSQWAAQLQGETTGCRYYYFYRCKFNDTTAAHGKVIYPGDEGSGFRVNGNTKDIVLEQCEMVDNARHGVQVTQGGPDGWLFDRCVIRGNKGLAFGSGPAVGAFETPGCVVAGNGSDKLPEAKPFAAPPPVIAPRVPEEARVGELVRFGVSCQGEVTQMKQALWDFGDGPPAAGDQVTHSYDRPGEYTVTVVVWNEAGRAARAMKALSVR